LGRHRADPGIYGWHNGFFWSARLTITFSPRLTINDTQVIGQTHPSGMDMPL
jgi:hypothetical protein